MTTRKDLRANAIQLISDAETLLTSGSYKNSCSQAALAVEMILKARFCRAKSWDRYPDNPREAQTFNQAAGLPSNTKLLIHDLDELMRLNEEHSIFQRQNLHVEWPKVGDWGIEKRYAPLSTVTAEEANTRVKESGKVVHQLLKYEQQQELFDMEAELTSRYGLPFLFAIEIADNNATLVISLDFIDEEHFTATKSWLQCRIKEIDDDLIGFSSATFVEPNAPVALACGISFPVHRSLCFSQGNVVVGIDYIFNGLVITACRWSEEQIFQSWENASEVTAPAPA